MLGTHLDFLLPVVKGCAVSSEEGEVDLSCKLKQTCHHLLALVGRLLLKPDPGQVLELTDPGPKRWVVVPDYPDGYLDFAP